MLWPWCPFSWQLLPTSPGYDHRGSARSCMIQDGSIWKKHRMTSHRAPVSLPLGPFCTMVPSVGNTILINNWFCVCYLQFWLDKSYVDSVNQTPVLALSWHFVRTLKEIKHTGEPAKLQCGDRVHVAYSIWPIFVSCKALITFHT